MQHIRKQINYKKPLNTKQMNKVRAIPIKKVWKCKATECLDWRMFGNVST